jgi:ferritin-like protein
MPTYLIGLEYEQLQQLIEQAQGEHPNFAKIKAERLFASVNRE